MIKKFDVIENDRKVIEVLKIFNDELGIDNDIGFLLQIVS